MSALSVGQLQKPDENLPRDDKDLLAEIRERRDDAFQADQDNVTAAQGDLKMISGDQWPENVRAEREGEDEPRPCITQNELTQFVRQVTGDMRAQRPAIKVSPAGGGATKAVADIYTGLIREIENRAATTRPYIGGGSSAARCGIGHWRVLHDYESDKSFDQCIKLEPIDNPFSVLWDPLATNITRSDATFCFVTSLMSEDAFKAAYPDAQDIDYDSNEPWANEWLDRSAKSVRVAEYWRKKPTKRKLIELADGFVGFEDELAKMSIAPLAVRRTRDVESFDVEVTKTNGFEILEKPVKWPTRHIPIVAVVGEEYNVGEKRVRHSVHRFAKDAQQMLNYWLSAQTEYIALQPKAPYILTAKQVGKYATDWKEANTKNRPVLIYEHDGNAPPPQRAQPPVSAQGISDQIMLAKEAMRSTTGIYDAGLGKKSNETSGVAIAQRQRESDVGTSEFLDNFAASIAYTGEIIVDLIPHIYDTERQLMVLAEDGKESFEEVNKRMMTPEGEKIINALSHGRYAVTVSTGPSYTTRRQEAAESMLAFVQANPQAAQIVLDLIAKNMDWPGADQFAERFKKMLPPQLQPETDDPEEQQQRQMAAQQAAKQAEKQDRAENAEIAVKESTAAKNFATAQSTQQSGQLGAAKARTEYEQSAIQTEGMELDNHKKQIELLMAGGQLQQIIGAEVQKALALLAPVQMAAIAQAGNGGLPLDPASQPVPAGL